MTPWEKLAWSPRWEEKKELVGLWMFNGTFWRNIFWLDFGFYICFFLPGSHCYGFSEMGWEAKDLAFRQVSEKEENPCAHWKKLNLYITSTIIWYQYFNCFDTLLTCISACTSAPSDTRPAACLRRPAPGGPTRSAQVLHVHGRRALALLLAIHVWRVVASPVIWRENVS